MSTVTEETGPFTSSSKLEDQAASAALHVTRDSSKPSSQSSHPLLDEDGKLSAAGAATSLKYARIQDLPSYPSSGLNIASAGAAASLADSNQKSFEHWKPGSIPAANKAATAAKNYEMDPLWYPERSSDGASAATQAFRMKSPSAITSRDSGADGQRKALLAATGAFAGSRRRAGTAPSKAQGDGGWALKAAASPTIKSRQDGEFAAGDPGFEASRIQNMSQKKVDPKMYGSTPPVALEVAERNRKDTLQAASIAMAKKMYAIQQSQIDAAKKEQAGKSGAVQAHHRGRSDASSTFADFDSEPANYLGLEEAARKLAQARLAKIHDEHAEYRQYYGQNEPPQPKYRMSFRGRRRASSDGSIPEEDEEQSRKIRSQMSIFTTKLAEVDGKKRQADRDNLMAIAQKNVQARMTVMDEKVFADTGKQTPAQAEAWKQEARAKAQASSEDRLLNHGKVHIGGGKYLDQSNIDEIARARLQPTLDEISDKAEKQRARDEEIRVEQERAKREAEAEKVRQAEIKAEQKRIIDKEKTEQKAVQAEANRIEKEKKAAEKEKQRADAAAEKRVREAEKDQARIQAAAEKDRLRAEKEAEKEEKRKSDGNKGRSLTGLFGKGVAVGTGAAAVGGASTLPTGLSAPEGEPQEGETVHDKVTMEQDSDQGESKSDDLREDITPKNEEANEEQAPVANEEPLASPTSPKGAKVKSWFKTRFRSGSKTQKDEDTPGFVGATTLTDTGVAEEQEKDNDSMRDVAMAGHGDSARESEDMYGASPEPTPATATEPAAKKAERSPSISSISDSDYGPEADGAVGGGAPEGSVASDPPRGRRGFKERFLSKVGSNKQKETTTGGAQYKDIPSGPTPVEKTGTNGTEGTDMEEARDTFEEEKLAPPKTDEPAAAAATVSPARGGEKSRFTEEL